MSLSPLAQEFSELKFRPPKNPEIFISMNGLENSMANGIYVCVHDETNVSYYVSNSFLIDPVFSKVFMDFTQIPTAYKFNKLQEGIKNTPKIRAVDYCYSRVLMDSKFMRSARILKITQEEGNPPNVEFDYVAVEVNPELNLESIKIAVAQYVTEYLGNQKNFVGIRETSREITSVNSAAEAARPITTGELPETNMIGGLIIQKDTTLINLAGTKTNPVRILTESNARQYLTYLGSKSFIVITGGNFSNGSTANFCINSKGDKKGALFLRNCLVLGYNYAQKYPNFSMASASMSYGVDIAIPRESPFEHTITFDAAVSAGWILYHYMQFLLSRRYTSKPTLKKLFKLIQEKNETEVLPNSVDVYNTYFSAIEDLKRAYLQIYKRGELELLHFKDSYTCRYGGGNMWCIPYGHTVVLYVEPGKISYNYCKELLLLACLTKFEGSRLQRRDSGPPSIAIAAAGGPTVSLNVIKFALLSGMNYYGHTCLHPLDGEKSGSGSNFFYGKVNLVKIVTEINNLLKGVNASYQNDITCLLGNSASMKVFLGSLVGKAEMEVTDLTTEKLVNCMIVTKEGDSSVLVQIDEIKFTRTNHSGYILGLDASEQTSAQAIRAESQARNEHLLKLGIVTEAGKTLVPEEKKVLEGGAKYYKGKGKSKRKSKSRNNNRRNNSKRNNNKGKKQNNSRKNQKSKKKKRSKKRKSNY